MPRGFTLFLILLIVPLAGCRYETVVNDPWDNFRKIDPNSDRPTTAGPLSGDQGMPVDPDAKYTIHVATLEGANQAGAAARLIRQLYGKAGLTQTWTAQKDGRTLVYLGRYQDADGPAATDDLNRLKASELPAVAEARVIAFAGPGDAVDLTDDANLARHRGKGLFTLQVGHYNDSFGPEFREAAEAAARALRDEGQEAYYYHGSHMSLVTIGLFGQEHFEMVETAPGVRVQGYGPAIKAIQKKYPYNLANGRIRIDHARGREVKHESFVVRLQ